MWKGGAVGRGRVVVHKSARLGSITTPHGPIIKGAGHCTYTPFRTEDHSATGFLDEDGPSGRRAAMQRPERQSYSRKHPSKIVLRTPAGTV